MERGLLHPTILDIEIASSEDPLLVRSSRGSDVLGVVPWGDEYVLCETRFGPPPADTEHFELFSQGSAITAEVAQAAAQELTWAQGHAVDAGTVATERPRQLPPPLPRHRHRGSSLDQDSARPSRRTPTPLSPRHKIWSTPWPRLA